MQTREIALTQGQVALIDEADYPEISKHKWHAAKREHTFYAETKVKKRGVLMHHMILGKKPGFVTDHINGNGLDNRSSNLRFASPCQNMANKKRHSRSGYKGVHAHKEGGFVAAARKNGAYHYAGYHATAIQAARAYDAKAIELHGEFARLNFPNEVSQ